jgi:hypothetical protein
MADTLDTKAVTLSFSTVDHLRWDLHQIFQFAVAERLIPSNPAELLFTPREAKREQTRPMTKEEVNKLFSVLPPSLALAHCRFRSASTERDCRAGIPKALESRHRIRWRLDASPSSAGCTSDTAQHRGLGSPRSLSSLACTHIASP